MSDKFIPGGSKIRFTAPKGFFFRCQKREVRGLANTTTCFAKKNVIEFTVDTQAPMKPNFPFAVILFVKNPEFTP